MALRSGDRAANRRFAVLGLVAMALLAVLGGVRTEAEEIATAAAPEFDARLALDSGWFFSKGDNPAWKDAAPAEASRDFPVGRKWEECGLEGYDGYGWYFRNVTPPPALLGRPVVLFLGKIDDADEVFVNGRKVGGLGSFPPAFATAWNTNRHYLLPAGALKPGTNLVAVRVYDGGGGGGLHHGIPVLQTEEDYERSMRDRFRPHRSFHHIPFSNGLASSKLNLERNFIDSFREHIYSQYDESTRTRDFCKALHFGARPAAIREAEYVPGTGIVRFTSEMDGRRITGYAFAPFDSDKKKLYLLVDLGEGYDGSAAFTARFEIGAGDTFAGEGMAVAQRSSDGKDYLTYKLFTERGSLPATMKNAIVSGAMPTGARWIGLSVTYSREGSDSEPETQSPRELVEKETAWWAAWHASEAEPRYASESERALFRQSTAILKMGQCREPGRPHGQVLASLPPGHWNICWIRDGAYAVNGLVLSRHFAEARDALRFFLEAECGRYVTWEIDGIDYGVGMPYRISVCRYYGNGTEESDGGEDPNIELDGFGLFLWVMEEYVRASGDETFLRAYEERIFQEIADVIVHCLEPGTRVMKRESGPWERHLVDNGYNGAKRFSYTSATAYRGLLSAAALAERLGRAEKAASYRAAAADLREGFRRQFIAFPCGHVKGNLEERGVDRHLDAGAVEAVNFDVVDSRTARLTLEAFDRFLKKPYTPGYMRNDDGGDYDRAEWIVIDLRTASAWARLGERARHETLVGWVTAQSAANFNIIAELYSEDGADYEGAVPMCGFGPGAYITALFDRP